MKSKPDSDFQNVEISPEKTNKYVMSDNGCDGNLSDSESESVSDSKRRPAVGLRGAPGRQYTPAELLEARTIKTDTCWLVQGYRNPRNGYVHIGARSDRWLAHRLAYALAYGPIPPGLKVLHRCDVPQCVRPDHLFVGTQADNIHDCIRKGRRNAFGRQKLTIADVQAIRLLAAAGAMYKTIATRFGIARNTVSAIVSGVAWSHVPMQFERVATVALPVRGDVGDFHPAQSAAQPSIAAIEQSSPTARTA